MDESNEITCSNMCISLIRFVYSSFWVSQQILRNCIILKKNKQEKKMKSESCDHCKSSLHVDQDYDAFSCVFLDLH